jgi:hypothetical protein
LEHISPRRPGEQPCGGLEKLLRVIEEAFPVPGRFRSRLPEDVAELSRLLTSGRFQRGNGYLSRPNLLSAYLRFFLPWNVFRLHRLFSFAAGNGGAASLFGLTGGGVITDIGCGPLTLPVSLWLLRPELRKLDLEFRCIDHSAPALEAGKKLLTALARTEGGITWKIRTIHDSIDAPVRGGKAAFVTAINVFNEMYRDGGPALWAKKAAGVLERLCSAGGSILVMEPGIPQSGAFIAALREVLLEKGRKIAAPCIHGAPCPMPGMYGEHSRQAAEDGPPFSSRRPGRGRSKWCHFAFDTAGAPAELHRLSSAAGIPKERAVFSFLLASQTGGVCPETGGRRVLVISDPFSVGKAQGRYCCSEKGLVLVTGSRGEMEAAAPGTLLEPVFKADEMRDPKTGAIVAVMPRDDIRPVTGYSIV